eukprot:jgi/Tetstr1/442051/TSEL_030232.t1
MSTRVTLRLQPSSRRGAAALPKAAGNSAPRAFKAARHVRCQATSASDGSSGVSFKVQQEVPFKTFFKVCGNVEALGAWDLDKAPAMEWSEGHVWSLDLPVPAGVDLEYKLVKIPRREPIAWEGGPNRLLKVPDSELVLKLAFDDSDATEVVSGELAAEAPVGASDAVPESVMEEVVEAAGDLMAEAPKKTVEEAVTEAAEEVAAAGKEQGVDMEDIVEAVVEAAEEVAEEMAEAAEDAKPASSGSSGATVAAASVVEDPNKKAEEGEEEEEKKSPLKGMLGGLFGGFGKK